MWQVWKVKQKPRAWLRVSAVLSWSLLFSAYSHENASGFYGVAAYFFAKVLSDLIPMRVVPMFGSCLILYFMAGK